MAKREVFVIERIKTRSAKAEVVVVFDNRAAAKSRLARGDFWPGVAQENTFRITRYIPAPEGK
jgi:hypothetical protein